MAYATIATQQPGDIVRSADINQLQTNDTYLKGQTDGHETRLGVLESSSGSIVTKTADYTILDDDGYNAIFANPSARAITINLPTLADNLGREITVKIITAGGAVSLTPESAETIDGVNAAFVMQSSGDHCTVVGQATGWRILSAQQSIDTGWIGQTSTNARTVGNVVVTHDNLTGVYTIGEVITEYSDAGRTSATGQSGILMAIVGATLILKNVAGTGNFVNDKYLKGGTSASVSQVNGNTAQQETALYHYFGKSVGKVKVQFLASTDKAEGTTIILGGGNNVYIGATDDGFSIWGINTSSLYVSCTTALYGISTTGANTAYTTVGYVRILAEVTI